MARLQELQYIEVVEQRFLLELSLYVLNETNL